ncbi:hypothetical protein COV20_01420 [Candidatus Woesearchaeota archaeon CG10_big_fil_rev_8_21_14_0_10_45_16]|nr:MAG: hypothetical protein COV20_01420 [Candidatus Woesearchaeota archaeon CG10_big_fil_rev_8_21_14_0_10_45_16]
MAVENPGDFIPSLTLSYGHHYHPYCRVNSLDQPILTRELDGSPGIDNLLVPAQITYRTPVARNLIGLAMAKVISLSDQERVSGDELTRNVRDTFIGRVPRLVLYRNRLFMKVNPADVDPGPNEAPFLIYRPVEKGKLVQPLERTDYVACLPIVHQYLEMMIPKIDDKPLKKEFTRYRNSGAITHFRIDFEEAGLHRGDVVRHPQVYLLSELNDWIRNL